MFRSFLFPHVGILALKEPIRHVAKIEQDPPPSRESIKHTIVGIQNMQQFLSVLIHVTIRAGSSPGASPQVSHSLILRICLKIIVLDIRTPFESKAAEGEGFLPMLQSDVFNTAVSYQHGAL
jgi:hypothetical protein